MADNVRVTKAGALVVVEGDTDQVRATKTGAMVLVRQKQDDIRATAVGAMVLVAKPWPTSLDASLTTWLRVQAAKQDSFGTATPPEVALPVVFDYQQGDTEQIAQWDAGLWTGLEIVDLTAEYATFTLRGALFFELLPVLLGAGFGEMAASGAGPYTYAGAAGPDAVGISTGNPLQPLPRWGILNRTSGVLEDDFLAASVVQEVSVTSAGTGAQTLAYSVLLAMPQDAKRVLINCVVEHTYTTSSAAHTSDGAVYQIDQNAASPASVNDLAFSSAAANTTFTQNYTVEWTRGGLQTEWLGSREAFEASPPTTDGLYCRWEITVSASALSGRTATSAVTHTAEIVEIELEDGTIYTPGASVQSDPVPYTFRFGGNQGSGGSMVQVQDAYCHALNLSYNLNEKIVMFESQWFGKRIDDNSGVGYAPAAVPLPSGLAMVNGLLSTIGIQDAGASGGAFDALTHFDCSIIEWTLEIDTGLRPAWAADGNGLTYCGVRHEEPRAIWKPHIRTTADNYAVTLTKAQLRQFQEVQLQLLGTNREFILQMTGRWLGKLGAHNRGSAEVVMQPTFQLGTPHGQTTTPHWLSWTLEAGWEH